MSDRARFGPALPRWGGDPIAIVDDEVAMREATRSLLASAGYRILDFPSAEAFLSSESGSGAACLVLDVGLPGMSGLQLQSHLAGAGRRIPIVFVSGQCDAGGQLRAQALCGGALAFLSKPFGAATLLGAIGAAIGHPDSH